MKTEVFVLMATIVIIFMNTIGMYPSVVNIMDGYNLKVSYGMLIINITLIILAIVQAYFVIHIRNNKYSDNIIGGIVIMMSKRDKCSLKLLLLVVVFALIADQSLRYTDIIFSFISAIAIMSAAISVFLLCWQMYYSRR